MDSDETMETGSGEEGIKVDEEEGRRKEGMWVRSVCTWACAAALGCAGASSGDAQRRRGEAERLVGGGVCEAVTWSIDCPQSGPRESRDREQSSE